MLYNQFIVAKGDFLQNLLEVQSLPSSITEKNSLSDIREKFDRYEALVENELKSPRGKKRESTEGSREKEELINGIFNQLNELKETSKENNLRRFRELGQAQEASMNFIIYVGAGTLGLIILISLIITRGITRPISQLVGKTREMAEGTYRGDLKIKSPPEVARLNQAFNEMCEQLNKVDKMKSDFFSIMSHELRTPLTSIREGTNLLLEGVGGHLNEKQEKLIGIVSEESSRLIELVNSLLDLAKMEAGMMPFNFSQVEITPVITLAAQLLEPLLITKNIKLHLEVPAALPAIRLDSERMLQAIKNLLANAIKFSRTAGQFVCLCKIDRGSWRSPSETRGPGSPGTSGKKYLRNSARWSCRADHPSKVPVWAWPLFNKSLRRMEERFGSKAKSEREAPSFLPCPGDFLFFGGMRPVGSGRAALDPGRKDDPGTKIPGGREI